MHQRLSSLILPILILIINALILILGNANPNPLRTMILKSSKVVLLFLQLILVCVLATAIAAEVQGECSADGSCEAADADVDAAVLTAPGGDEQRRRITPACEDKESLCGFWASEGECENNPSYMLSE